MDNFIRSCSYVFENNLLSVVLFLFLIYATYTDVKFLKIFNKFNVFIVFSRIIFAFSPIYRLPFRLENLYASALVFSIMLTIAVIFMHKMGGDIKFISCFMLFFDITYMLIFMLIASILSMIYSFGLKYYLKSSKEKILSKDDSKECIKYDNIMDRINYFIIKLMIIKKPTAEELVNMNDKDFNKYKLPFAPFFLMSYIVTYIIYIIG